MRITGIRGFTHYDLYNRQVLQRGHLERLSYDELRSLFDGYDITHVVGLARKENMILRQLDDEQFSWYHYYPIPDNKLPKATADDLMTIAHDIAVDLQGKEAVLSYCNAGRNRSGLMNALILRELLSLTGKEALEMVRRERPRAIANEHFEAFLLGLDRV